jgi:hypothetical protein
MSRWTDTTGSIRNGCAEACMLIQRSAATILEHLNGVAPESRDYERGRPQATDYRHPRLERDDRSGSCGADHAGNWRHQLLDRRHMGTTATFLRPLPRQCVTRSGFGAQLPRKMDMPRRRITRRRSPRPGHTWGQLPAEGPLVPASGKPQAAVIAGPSRTTSRCETQTLCAQVVAPISGQLPRVTTPRGVLILFDTLVARDARGKTLRATADHKGACKQDPSLDQRYSSPLARGLLYRFDDT